LIVESAVELVAAVCDHFHIVMRGSP
jgi:hypothetical protein